MERKSSMGKKLLTRRSTTIEQSDMTAYPRNFVMLSLSARTVKRAIELGSYRGHRACDRALDLYGGAKQSHDTKSSYESPAWMVVQLRSRDSNRPIVSDGFQAWRFGRAATQSPVWPPRMANHVRLSRTVPEAFH